MAAVSPAHPVPTMIIFSIEGVKFKRGAAAGARGGLRLWEARERRIVLVGPRRRRRSLERDGTNPASETLSRLHHAA